MYIALLAVGTLFILAANVYKAWSDKRGADEKRVAEANAAALVETRHQEMLEVVAAAQQQRDAYLKAYEELKNSSSTAPAPPPSDNTGLNLKYVDDRLDRALRQVAPTMVKRLQHERALAEANAAADALASKWNAVLRPKFLAMVPTIRAGILRGKNSGLFPSLSVVDGSDVPEELILRSYPGDRFVTLMTVYLDSNRSLVWEVNVGRGYALLQQEVAPKQVQMPQLLVYVRKNGNKALAAGLNVNPATLKLSADWAPQNAAAQKVTPAVPASFRQLDGDNLILAWVGELLAATRLLDIEMK